MSWHAPRGRPRSPTPFRRRARGWPGPAVAQVVDAIDQLSQRGHAGVRQPGDLRLGQPYRTGGPGQHRMRAEAFQPVERGQLPGQQRLAPSLAAGSAGGSLGRGV